MTISLEQVEFWLASTIGSDEGDLRSASQALENAQSISAFPFVLLTLSSGHVEEGRRLAAATYLKNLLKAQWHQPDFLSSSERGDFRNQLVDSLLRSDPLVLKALNEAFRLIVDNDFTRENIWPELVPAMKMALQKSNLLNGQSASEIRTFNALTAVQTMIRPFQYFMNPKLAKEPVPEQLELLSSELLVPLNQLFHVLVGEAKMSKECGASANDNSLLVICKCFHLAVRAHLPSSLQPYLGNWCQSFFTLLETIQLQQRVEGSEKLMRMKAWKRSLQIFCTMVSRHRKHVDKILPILSTALLDLVTRAAAMTEDLHPLQERVISSAFDTLSNILETGPGWRLISSHFSSLLEGAIFPALKITEKDFIDWNEDPEEYLRKNLPSDLDYTSGWREDLYTPRRSALNLLGLISISKGPPTAVNTAKRKKAGNASKSKEARGTVGELLVVPFLSRFHLPPDGCTLTSEPVVNYYGVLLAYGGIQQFLKMQKPEHLLMLLRSHVLPLYSMSSPSPFLLANANWLLGEFASFLPEDLSTEIYDALVKALLAPDAGNISWRPVRNSAAAAISALLEEEFKPTEWLPVLKAAVTGARSEDNDDATTALQVLTKIADSAEEDIVPHIPTIILAIKGEVYKRIPDIPEPWPQVVESGFSAIVGLAQTWDSATAEVDEDDEAKIPNWKESCIPIGCAISELLQKAWLNYPEGVTETEVSPPSSCLNDISTLIVMMVKYATEAEKVGTWKIEELLHTWSDLVADWSAWEEEEDIAVFEAIKEIISLQERFPLPHFGIASMPPVPALPVQPRSILEGIITFISSAIEVAYPAATWRACRIGHALLHVAGISFESDDITPLLAGRLFHAAGKRLVQLTSTKVPLAKPLVLLISMCYVCSPNSVILVLSENIESREMILAWAEALAELAERLEDPMLSLESEIKLTVAALLRLLNDICTNHIHDKGICDLKHTFLHALLTACIRLKELEDTEEETNDEEEETDNEDEDEEEEETDDEDDDSEDDEEEETEDQFLERYAQKAQELEKDALEEAEGGEEEDGQELEIGVLGLTEQMRTVYNFLESHGRELMNESPLPLEFVSGFLEHFPDSAQFFHR